MFDAQLYREKAEVEEWRGKGPIKRFRDWLLGKQGSSTREDIDGIEARIDAEIAEAAGLRGGRHLGAGGGSRAACSGRGSKAARAGEAVGPDGRDHLSRGREAGESATR